MAGAGAHVGARASAAAKIQLIARAEAMARSAADIRGDIQRLEECGDLAPEEEPVTCMKCGYPLDQDSDVCGYCGALVSEGADDLEDGSPEDDLSVEEETAVSDLELEMDIELAEDLDLPEILKGILVEMGWSAEDALEPVLEFVRLWEEEGGIDSQRYADVLDRFDNLKEELKQRLSETSVRDTIIHEFQMLEEVKSISPSSPVAEISMKREGEQWRVEVHDPLQDIRLTTKGRKEGKIQVAKGVWRSVEAYLKDLNERRIRLRAIGQALLDDRSDFFKASSLSEAEKVLDREPLLQNTLARKVGMPPSTLSRWCNRESGIWVSTPHGEFHLADFFKRVAGTRRAGNLTKIAVLGIVWEVKRVVEDGTADVILTSLRDDHRIYMDARTLRYYLKDIKDLETIEETMEQVGGNNPDAIREKLLVKNVDLTEDRVVELLYVFESLSGKE